MSITNNLQQLRQLVNDTAQGCQRKIDDICLLAVSKSQPGHAIRAAFAAGQRDFGENYWQEAQSKQAELQDLPIVWHFIGPIQSNKAADIARQVQWVHSLDRVKIARLLSDNRPDKYPPLNVCLQINLDNEASKSGISAEQAPELIECVQHLPGLRLRGLMAIPEPRQGDEAQYQSLLRLTQLRDTLNQRLNLNMDSLSMGMSDDLKPAIRAGSTLLRIGRALFGERS